MKAVKLVTILHRSSIHGVFNYRTESDRVRQTQGAFGYEPNVSNDDQATTLSRREASIKKNLPSCYSTLNKSTAIDQPMMIIY